VLIYELKIEKEMIHKMMELPGVVDSRAHWKQGDVKQGMDKEIFPFR
jgi:hypothetical protein